MNFYPSPFSFWTQGQPDNWGDEPGQDCGQVVGYNNGHWNDENCDVERKYICKHINRECQIRARRPTGSSCVRIKSAFLQRILGRSAT